MSDEMKLLYALCEALGFEVRRIETSRLTRAEITYELSKKNPPEEKENKHERYCHACGDYYYDPVRGYSCCGKSSIWLCPLCKEPVEHM